MKRILIGISLLATTFLAACGQSVGNLVVNPSAPRGQPVFTMSDIPFHLKPDLIEPYRDARLGGVEINLLLRGQTVVSRSIDESEAIQYSYFSPDGLLAINPRPGRLVLGRWRIDGRQLCYDLGPEEFCSSVFRTVASANGVHIYYFARIGEGIMPTVFVDDIQTGDTIPIDRLPKTL
jgi:hypothetical protein